MHKWIRILAITLGVAVLGSIVGVGSVAFAADPQPTSPATTSVTSPWADIFLSKLAAKLNTTVDKLKSAMTGARNDTINQLAAEGKITADQKKWMLDRIQQGTYGPGGFGAGGFGHGRAFNGTPPWNQTPPTK